MFLACWLNYNAEESTTSGSLCDLNNGASWEGLGLDRTFPTVRKKEKNEKGEKQKKRKTKKKDIKRWRKSEWKEVTCSATDSLNYYNLFR